MSDEQPLIPTPLPAVPQVSNNGFFEARATVYSKAGTPIYLTGHAPFIDQALDGLSEAVKYAMEKHGWTPAPPVAPSAPHTPAPTRPAPPPAHAPTPQATPSAAPGTPPPAAATTQQATQGGVVKIDSISTDYGKSGDLFLRCKGGNFQKFGLSAYKELFPAELYAQMASWAVKQEYQPLPGMEYAVHDGKKVLAFQSTP